MDADAHIRAFIPLQRLPRHLQDQAVSQAEVRHYERGTLIYAQGFEDDLVYYLLSGTVELIYHGKINRILSAINKAALRALDSSGRKRYSVRAVDAARVVVLPAGLLDRLVTEAEAEGMTDSEELEVAEIATARSSNWMIRMLQSELFSTLPATSIQRVFARMEQLELKADEVVVQQGSPGDYYYVIERGYCEVSRAIVGGRGQIHLADLGPGSAFGEEALIANAPRNATVTMLSDGRLMRLPKRDFDDLILSHVLEPLDYEAAAARVADGAVWLDVRYPEEHANGGFAGSENIPVNMLRLQSNRLRKDFRYVVCADAVDQAAIGAFLLAERGFAVAHLGEPIAAVAARLPEALVVLPQADATQATVIHFPGAEMTLPSADPNSLAGRPIDPLENTLNKIAGLSTYAEAERAMHDTTPVETFADTATGRSLAEIIESLEDEHDSLAPSAPAPTPTTYVAPAAEMDRDDLAATGARERAPRDAIGQLMAEMEGRLRGEIAKAVENQTTLAAIEYQTRLARMREDNEQELARREAQIRETYASEYGAKEQLLRGYYKKLIGLANKISRQKAQLQEAKKQFEAKLASANQLYREVEEMRKLLSDQISFMDDPAFANLPQIAGL